MSDRRQVRRSIKQLQKIKTWQLILLLVLMGFVSATFLRMNNTAMVQRRNAVLSADKSGDVNEMRGRIYDLQRWSAAHMNADTGTFYLQEQYNRDAQRAFKDASEVSNDSLQAHIKAEAVCHPQFHGWSTAYMQCFMNELAKYPGTDKLPEPKLPSPALYRYSFVSPLWSPDFAGWSIVVCGIIILMIITRTVSLVVLRIMLHRNYQSV